MDGWMICNFTSFSTVFQSYQDDRWMIMNDSCNGTLFTVEKISPRAGLELRTSGPVLNLLSYWGSLRIQKAVKKAKEDWIGTH